MKWNKEMETFLQNYYDEKPDEWFAQKLGVTKDAVESKRLRMGLHRERSKKYNQRDDGWSELEVEYVKMGHGKVANRRMAKVLGRPMINLQRKIKRLGLSGGGSWIRDEYEILNNNEAEVKRFLDIEMEIKQRRGLKG